jgi:hypothetical protein
VIYRPANIIRRVKCKKSQGTGHVDSTAQTKHAWRTLVGQHPFGRTKGNGEIILSFIYGR